MEGFDWAKMMQARVRALELFPEREPTDGWVTSDFDFLRFLDFYPGLWPAPGHRFEVSYKMQGGNQATRIYARNRETMTHFMLGLTGEGTAAAYLQAALLDRDAGEMGATWHHCWWRSHHLLERHPFLDDAELSALTRDFCDYLQTTPYQLKDLWQGLKAYHHWAQEDYLAGRWSQSVLTHSLDWSQNIAYNQAEFAAYRETRFPLPVHLEALRLLPHSDPNRWTWTQAAPDHWYGVEMGPDQVQVVLHSWCGRGQEAVWRHRAQFTRGFYVPKWSEETIATGPMGYMV